MFHRIDMGKVNLSAFWTSYKKFLHKINAYSQNDIQVSIWDTNQQTTRRHPLPKTIGNVSIP